MTSAAGAASLKAAILVVLCLQNTAYTLLRRYATAVAAINLNAQAVLAAGEAIKLVVSGAVGSSPDPDSSDAVGTGLARLVWLVANSQKMFMLAAIYAAMNILSFVSLKRVDAGTFTVCAQLKVLTTATFSFVLLGRQLSLTKWRALVGLMLSVILVVHPASQGKVVADGSNDTFEYLLGVGAVLAEVSLSGFASIYFEKVIKASGQRLSIWERNFQLAVWSLLLYAPFCLWSSPAPPSPADAAPEPEGWPAVVWVLAVLGAGGGLLVAATLKYADSITKTLATASAIVLSTVAGHALLDGPFNVIICIGCILVIVNILNYQFDTTPKPPVAPELKEVTTPKGGIAA